mmetsp:Transcript_4659/g.5913  ORF Transcript_4659/g.5913 Transcript_4659/m.5913 type:complete len:82 (-) Transcript_4659:66-311(-)
MIFYHQQYHPNNPPNHKIQELFKKHCSKIFKNELDLDRFIIANSKAKSLQSLLPPSKLKQRKGDEVSTLIKEYFKPAQKPT